MTAGVFSAFIWLHTEHADVPNWVEFYQKDAKVVLHPIFWTQKRWILVNNLDLGVRLC